MKKNHSSISVSTQSRLRKLLLVPTIAVTLLALLVAGEQGRSQVPREEQAAPTQPEIAAATKLSANATPDQASAGQPQSDLPLALIDRERGTALPILVAQDAPPNTRDAAKFLADNIEKISGVRPEVLESLPSPLPEKAIWVGYQPAMKEVFPGADFRFNHPEEIVLEVNGNHAAIMGRDIWDPKFPTYPGRRFEIKNWQKESGTANAVFTFLQDIIGVRWLYPGETGTDYPKADRLNVDPLSFRYHPQFRSRASVFHQMVQGYIKAGEEQNWVKHQRLLLHSLEMNGGHYFKNWWDKYGKTRPELFALQPDGTRGTFPEPTHRRKLCEGEPLVWKTWLEEQSAHLAKYPSDTILPAMPNDSYAQGHCIDPRSRAWDPDPSETDVRVSVKWKGHAEEWVPLSDRYVTFVNTLAKMVKEKYPDQELLVSTNSYGYSRPKPVRAVPADNVLIISVANFAMRDETFRKEHKQDFLNWAKISKNIIWRPNIGNHGGHRWGMHDVPFQQIMEDFRFVADEGAIGVFFDMFYENWGSMAPFYYLLGQLAWNPYADGNAILEDYFQRCYGPGAGPMREFWLLMEKTRNEMVNTVGHALSALYGPEYFTAELFEKANALIAQARTLTKGDEKYGRRLDFTESGLKFAQGIVGIRELMVKFEAAKGDEQEAIGEQVIARWAALFKEAEAYPEFVFNTKRLKAGGEDGNKRITGLHPSNPVKRSTLRQLKESDLDLN